MYLVYILSNEIVYIKYALILPAPEKQVDLSTSKQIIEKLGRKLTMFNSW